MVSSRSNQFTLSYKSFGEYGDWRGLSSTPPPQNARKNQNKSRKNGGHKIAIVREPYNIQDCVVPRYKKQEQQSKLITNNKPKNMPVNKMGKKTKKNNNIVQNRKKFTDKIPEFSNINDPRKAWKD